MTGMRFSFLSTLPCLKVAALSVLLAGAVPAMASVTDDPLIDGARQCTQYFPIEEKKNNIPTHLLAAIATTESGRFHKGLGMMVPWPWTINVNGKGYFFNSKAEAIAQTQHLLAAGQQSIDVGCMQVNLKHHPKAFADLNAAFNPETNVAYASKFLHDNYATLGDWIKATAAYHSRTAAYGQQYLVDIERNWNRIVGKVAEARASKAGGSTMSASAAQPASGQGVSGAPRIITTVKPMQEARHVRVIQVNDALRQHSEVMVVRPSAPTPPSAPAAPVAVADATPAPAPSPVGDSVRRVSLDNASNSALGASKPAGPKFVFAN
jgi:hypothetical protein